MAVAIRAGQVGQVGSAAAGPARRPRYLPIAEHGLIGDLHTVALVGTEGTIDWYCCPRFDSPSVFVAKRQAQRGTPRNMEKLKKRLESGALDVLPRDAMDVADR